MSSGFEVSFAELDAIVGRFGSAIEDLGNAGRTAPATVPGGAGGEAACKMLSHLLRNAATLCQGMEDAAAGVMQVRENYSAADERAAGHGGRAMEAR